MERTKGHLREETSKTEIESERDRQIDRTSKWVVMARTFKGYPHHIWWLVMTSLLGLSC